MLIARHRPRDPKIGDQRVAILGQQQVLGLDVAVHDPVVVSVLERLGRFPRDPKRVLHPELPLPPQPVPQRLALDEWHGEPELAGGLARVVDREDVRVLEPGGELDLALEPVGPQRGGELGEKHLQGHRPVVLQVLGQVDRGHPAPAELALEPVAIRQAACKLLAQVSHSRL